MKLDAGAIVVGAGLAGLVATSELAAAGREVRTVCSIRRPAPAPASPTCNDEAGQAVNGSGEL